MFFYSCKFGDGKIDLGETKIENKEKQRRKIESVEERHIKKCNQVIESPSMLKYVSNNH